MTDLKLAHGLGFADLYGSDGLDRIDGLFVDRLGEAGDDLKERLTAARKAPAELGAKGESDLLLALAPYIEDFLGTLFGIGGELRQLAGRHGELANLYACKRLFVRRRAVKTYNAEQAESFDAAALAAELAGLMGGDFTQLQFADHVMAWLDDEEADAEAIDLAARYAAWATQTAAGRKRHLGDVLFSQPGTIDLQGLVRTETVEENGIAKMQTPEGCHYHRDGFALTDHGSDLVGVLDEVNYCVICHHRGKDSCAKGIIDRKTGTFSKNPLGVVLAGCPLDMKISEKNQAKMDGLAIAALALAMVDNPLLAATGHRICNDCMLACIFQKQDPVNIPQVETRILKDVLALPWGFEIYSLLTRWNPLNIRRPLPLAASGYKVLVVGLGPAGFTLAHHLINEGHAVVAIDGLKIEPLQPALSGVTESGERTAFQPIRDIGLLYESLDDRVMAGFGGVAEYGITVRWDKNFLRVIRLLLERRQRFAMLGGVRFGGAIFDDSAFDLGFDHIALCLGAGQPTYLSVANGLARGVRQASDFLMALQLTGAAKMSSVANLQIRLPVVVIGGGLTAIDTATEALAYYVRQVEKFLARYETLTAELGEENVRAGWTEEEKGIADEFLSHAGAIGGERKAAAKAGREPRFDDLLDQWGGATIAYRRRMIDAPSYTLNHEEIVKALEQGVRFAELLAPAAVEIDDYGHVKALRLARQAIGEDGRPAPTGEQEVTLPAGSVLVAAGTVPNTVLTREHPGFAAMDGKYYQAVDEDGNPVTPENLVKPEQARVMMKVRGDGRGVSFFGDLHPSYAGNVVRAMASAKQGYPVINRMLAKIKPSPVSADDLIAAVNDGLRPRVHEVIRLTPNIVEVVVRAPFAARAFRPGQFFRLQNYESHAKRLDGTSLAMEGVALTGAWVDRDKGLVSVIVLEMGGSSSLCTLLEPGEPVVFMGPTGAPTETPAGETVLLAGGGLGNAVLFSIGQAFREAGSKVLYFGAYKKVVDRYHVEDILAAADAIVWCCDEAPGFEPSRRQDRAFVGNVVEAMAAYGKGDLGKQPIPIGDVDRLIAIGSDMMMAAVSEARHKVLKDYLKPGHIAIGSINSPMQCMMKQICSQCLQPHKDPVSGEESVVFSCFNQDQLLDHVVFPALRQRLCQNAVHEKLTRQWIAHCMEQLKERQKAV